MFKKKKQVFICSFLEVVTEKKGRSTVVMWGLEKKSFGTYFGLVPHQKDWSHPSKQQLVSPKNFIITPNKS